MKYFFDYNICYYQTVVKDTVLRSWHISKGYIKKPDTPFLKPYASFRYILDCLDVSDNELCILNMNPWEYILLTYQ